MTMTDAFDVVNQLGGAKSGPLGVTWGPLRVYCGGGIAGHSDQMWIDFPGHSDIAKQGPFTTKSALRKAVRRIIVGAIQFGNGMLAATKAFPSEPR